ncbi:MULTISPECIES: hypothetical protein [unclassified Mesorhizobium]|uniref:hypothetical protein n=1 Tax=unclassified Mesorhizobium TaxID=325217 RepID=UPI0004848718|nr:MULTISPECIES: hypothetical protein [unclassified Mesorhizobium]RWP23629.1 MAG: hypothetical protein EOR02_32245 [Mesorhizobium sp.]
MSEFAKTLQGFVEQMPDSRQKLEFLEALQVCPVIDLEVVPEERANKNMNYLRKRALESGQAYVIARAGRLDNLPQAAFVLSSDTILSLIDSVRGGTERKTARRRPASALLAQLKPLDASVVKMRLEPRSQEETVGGRGRVF